MSAPAGEDPNPEIATERDRPSGEEVLCTCIVGHAGVRGIHHLTTCARVRAMAEVGDLPRGTGYLYTHIACPECGEQQDDLEGDATGDEIVCDDCGVTFVIGETR